MEMNQNTLKKRTPNASQIFPEYNFMSSCPASSYYWSNFLAVQSIIEGAWLTVI